VVSKTTKISGGGGEGQRLLKGPNFRSKSLSKTVFKRRVIWWQRQRDVHRGLALLGGLADGSEALLPGRKIASRQDACLNPSYGKEDRV